jgi:hypothetical protein
MAVFCPVCNVKAEANPGKFCEDCGEGWVRHCAHCKEPVRKDAKFCRGCRASLAAAPKARGRRNDVVANGHTQAGRAGPGKKRELPSKSGSVAKAKPGSSASASASANAGAVGNGLAGTGGSLSSSLATKPNGDATESEQRKSHALRRTQKRKAAPAPGSKPGSDDESMSAEPKRPAKARRVKWEDDEARESNGSDMDDETSAGEDGADETGKSEGQMKDDKEDDTAGLDADVMATVESDEDENLKHMDARRAGAVFHG